MDNFISYYWKPETLENQELTKTFQQLVSKETAPEQKVYYFHILLESDSIVAQGIAFDHFFYAESLSRYGVKNPFHIYQDKLLVKAQEQLRTPSVTNTAPDGTLVVGANYASAFGVLAHLGNEHDLDLISPILATSNDMNVLFMGCFAAQRCLSMTKKNYPAIISSISRIIYHEEWPEDLRIIAISAFSDYQTPEVNDILLDAAQELSFPVSAHAVHLLVFRDLERYRDLLQELADSWPEDAKYPASEVRKMLKSKLSKSDIE